MSRLPEVFERYQAEITAALRAVLTERISPLYDMLRYHFGWLDEKGRVCRGPSGKAVRPTLCLLASQAAGGDYQRALPAAAAVELVHNFSLVHDDIQDDDRERRHQPTVWAVWGKPQAINAGTAMRLLADEAVASLAVPVEKRYRVQQLLDEATLRLVEGQYLDISYESRFDVTTQDYLTMIGGKTAALMACSVEVGAEVGTDDQRVVNGLRAFGWELGLAFQMRDDMLGVWGRPEETGKPAGSDIRRRKKTLPVVYGFEQATTELRRDMIRIYSNGALDDEAVKTVFNVLDSVGARAEVEKMAAEHIDRARGALDGLPIKPAARQDFEAVLGFLGERTF